MRAVHHTAIITTDVDQSLRFWRDGLGLVQLLDHEFTGDWRTLFGVDTDRLRSIFLGDPERPDSGIVELVGFPDAPPVGAAAPSAAGAGFFLVSLERDVDASLSTLGELGFAQDVRRISMPAPHGRTVKMAVLTAPDGVRVELIGAPE